MNKFSFFNKIEDMEIAKTSIYAVKVFNEVNESLWVNKTQKQE